MAMFHEIERRDVMDYIVSVAEENEHIVALITVGSGAFGYTDALSDLDMVVAIDKDENMEHVMDYIHAQLNKRLNFIYQKQALERRLQVYVSDHYLEIDIGYGAYTRAAAHRKDWKVIFDKTGTVDERMRNSWIKHENEPKLDRYNQKLAECADSVWHHLMHAAVAIKRRQPWRAAAEIEIARNLLIELLGCRYGLDTSRNRDVDKFPETVLAMLHKTLVSNLEQESLWINLLTLTDAVYTEFERSGEQAHIPVNRCQVNEYINACRNG